MQTPRFRNSKACALWRSMRRRLVREGRSGAVPQESLSAGGVACVAADGGIEAEAAGGKRRAVWIASNRNVGWAPARSSRLELFDSTLSALII